jgi:hypothetical protein
VDVPGRRLRVERNLSGKQVRVTKTAQRRYVDLPRDLAQALGDWLALQEADALVTRRALPEWLFPTRDGKLLTEGWAYKRFNVIGALVVTVAGAVGIERLRARGALQGDASLAVFLSGGFALAIVLIGLARGFNADLFAILFGSIVTVSTWDLVLIATLGVIVAAALTFFYRSLLASP